MNAGIGIVLAATATMVVTGTLAFAAGLGVTSSPLARAGAPVGECDASFTVSHATAAGNVTTTTIGDIADSACEGGALSVTLADATGARIAEGGPVAVPTDADLAPNSVAVPVSPQPDAGSVVAAHVVVVGP